MKLTLGVTSFSDEIFQYASQFGVTHLKVNSWSFLDDQQRGVIQLAKLREAQKWIGSYGLKIGVALLPQAEGSQHWNIRLGRPEREQEIQDVCESISVLGGEGVPVIEYVFNLAAVYGSTSEPTGRGGAVVRHYDHDQAKLDPAREGFAASEEEVWQRIGFFLEHVVPAAEKVGVKLACHHDDPPVPSLLGETRVLGSVAGMKRLVETVPSKVNGLNLCLGTIAEMGENVPEVIRYFGARGKVNHIHFRNVKGSIPRFAESFIDDGDTDMMEAMRALKEVGYRGTLIPDHTPRVAGDTPWGARGRAFALGYMKALMKALDIEQE